MHFKPRHSRNLPAQQVAALRTAASAGLAAADPGFDGASDLLPFLERASAAIRANALAEPGAHAALATASGSVTEFFDARKPFPVPDPSYDPATSVKYTPEQVRLHDVAGRAVQLVALVVPTADPHSPIGV
jgi:hypothetical protein